MSKPLSWVRGRLRPRDGAGEQSRRAELGRDLPRALTALRPGQFQGDRLHWVLSGFLTLLSHLRISL